MGAGRGVAAWVVQAGGVQAGEVQAGGNVDVMGAASGRARRGRPPLTPDQIVQRHHVAQTREWRVITLLGMGSLFCVNVLHFL